MQIYKYMNIGTAKPTPAEMQNIPHHMIDIITPDTPFTAAEFKTRATHIIKDIQSRGKTPILTGGTGFYINAAIYNNDFAPAATSNRAFYEDLAQKEGAEALHNRLKKADPIAADNIHPNNIKRVIRALAFTEETGIPFSSHGAAHKPSTLIHETRLFCLDWARETLYNRINQRTQEMLNAGLEEEVRTLLKKGYSPKLAPMQAIGYKEIIQLINGQLTLSDAEAAIKQATRRYAKRQITWFKNQTPNAHSLHPNEKTTAQMVLDIMEAC